MHCKILGFCVYRGQTKVRSLLVQSSRPAAIHCGVFQRCDCNSGAELNVKMERVASPRPDVSGSGMNSLPCSVDLTSEALFRLLTLS